MAQLQYKITAPDITSNIDNLKATTTDIVDQIHKQEERHYEYVKSNESHIANIENDILITFEHIQELEDQIRKNNICIRILCIGLGFAGVGLLSLVYHILTM